MEITSIVYAILSIGGLGLVFGLGLGIASKIFAVKVNPKFPIVREALPGANCGACGYAGCDAYAKAIVENEEDISLCPVGGASTIADLSRIMGIEAEDKEKEVAFVKCHGSKDVAKEKYDYVGVQDCLNADFLQGGGPKACEFGCLGLGSCVQACQFDAIDIIDGVAVINKEKCVACGACLEACPKDLITMVPYDQHIHVACHSHNKGKEVMTACQVGCISCRKCVKACPVDAIHMVDDVAVIDYDKCIECGKCVKACPTGAIES